MQDNMSKFTRYLLISFCFIFTMYTFNNLFKSLDYYIHYLSVYHGSKEVLTVENTRYQVSTRVLPSDH